MPIELDETIYMAILKDNEYTDMHKIDNATIKLENTQEENTDNIPTVLEYTSEPIECTVDFKHLDYKFIRMIKNRFEAARLFKILNRTKKFRIRKKLLARITRLLY